MAEAHTKTMTLREEYIATHPTSQRLYREAVEVFPNGVTHESRYMEPFPFYISRAAGSRKWDVDGHEYIDYGIGHGALLLGHGHPAVVAAVTEQLAKGTHYSACHELEIRWGQWVQRLVPSAEKVRFFSSGTEATMMALRLARAYTGRRKILKFQGHFHGWHDYVVSGFIPPFDVPVSTGVPAETLSTVLVAPPNDIAAVESLLSAHEDVAAVILEPGGGTGGAIPPKPGFLQQLREATARHGVVLIFDEVVTGFRHAPGGVQECTGVLPDLTTLAKILAGGYPGGAVAGKKEILEMLERRQNDAQWNRFRRIAHQGTFNANPLAAAAGVATLEIVAQGEACARASQRAADLRQGLNEVFRSHRLAGPPRRAGCVYGEASHFQIYLGEDCPQGDDGQPAFWKLPADRLMANRGAAGAKFLIPMLLEGVHVFGSGGMLSAAHTDEDIEQTVQAFHRAIRRLKSEGAI